MCWEQELQKQEALWLFTFQSGEQANNQQTTGGALFREHRIPVGWTQRSGLSPSLGQEGKVCKGFLERSLSLKEGCIGMKPSCVCPRDDLSDRDENLKRQRGERQPALMGTPSSPISGALYFWKLDFVRVVWHAVSFLQLTKFLRRCVASRMQISQVTVTLSGGPDVCVGPGIRMHAEGCWVSMKLEQAAKSMILSSTSGGIESVSSTISSPPPFAAKLLGCTFLTILSPWIPHRAVIWILPRSPLKLPSPWSQMLSLLLNTESLLVALFSISWRRKW